MGKKPKSLCYDCIKRGSSCPIEPTKPVLSCVEYVKKKAKSRPPKVKDRHVFFIGGPLHEKEFSVGNHLGLDFSVPWLQEPPSATVKISHYKLLYRNYNWFGIYQGSEEG